MKRDEVKIILELYRPGHPEDAKDPVIAEALAHVESYPEIRQWFDEARKIDARIAEHYNKVEPPADLKTNILAGMRLHAANSEDRDVSENAAFLPGRHDSMDRSTQSQAWWRNPWIGLAAVFALLFAITSTQRDAPPAASTLAQADATTATTLEAGIPPIIQFLAAEIDAVKSRQRTFDKESHEPATLQAYLASTGAPSPSSLPSAIESAPSIGCFTFEHNGIKMGMICFRREEVMHLTTVKKTDCMDQITEAPAVYELRDQAFKVWVEGDQVKILSIHGSKEKLPKFI